MYEYNSRAYASSTDSSSCEEDNDDDDDSGDGYCDDDKSLTSDVARKSLIEMIISHFKEHSVLWNTTDSGYGNNRKHQEAYNNIAQLINEQMNTDMKWQDIRKEIDKLKNNFRKECKRLAGSAPNPDNDVCDGFAETPKVSWLYEKLIFLKEHMRGKRKRGKKVSTYIIS